MLTDAALTQGSYSPLFLSKADLDLAVENVFSLRDTKREAATQGQFKAASQDLAVAEAAVRQALQLLLGLLHAWLCDCCRCCCIQGHFKP